MCWKLADKIEKRKNEILPAIEKIMFHDETIIRFLQESETIAPLQLIGLTDETNQNDENNNE